MPLEPDAHPPAGGGLLAVTFNLWVGQSPTQARRNLAKLVTAVVRKWGERPHVIALQEAKRFGGTIPGYRRFAHDEGHPDNSSTVLLIRSDLATFRNRDVDVDGPMWTGPKHNKIHPPRLFPGVTIQAGGRKWDVLAVHRTPGGPESRNADSWDAEDRDLEAWCDQRLRRTPQRPLVILGDWNNRKADPRPRGIRDLAKRVGGRLLVKGIDGALVRGCKGKATKLRRRYGSDAHRPVVIDLTTK